MGTYTIFRVELLHTFLYNVQGQSVIVAYEAIGGSGKPQVCL